jgi:hypothetical protein
MAVDYCVMLDCEPKRHFGGGDCSQGTVEVLELLKARNRAAVLRQAAAGVTRGKSPWSFMCRTGMAGKSASK